MGFESGVLEPGTVFGRDFKILRALKSGGMGAVYVVEQRSTGKQRALKVMNPELANDPATRERFVLEARAASQIDSDHVVEVVTAGVDEATSAPYLVMELLRGEELYDALARLGALPVGDVAEVLSQIGHALERAHAMGIVHRDLKPQNVFLAASRRKDSPFTAKLLDFGIAKLVADSHKTHTQPLGSPLYMSPEQTDSKGRITPATDVWALGLMVYKMLTGHEFWRETASLPALLREIVVEPIPFASARAAETGVASVLPVGFDAWFARCVTRDIDARFPEAGACARAFADLVEPGAPAGKLVIEAPTALTGQSFNAAMRAADLVGTNIPNTLSQQRTQLADPEITGAPTERAPAVTGPSPVSPEATTGQPIVATGAAPAPAPAARSFPKALIFAPLLLGGVAALAFALRGPSNSGAASGASSASGTPTASVTAALSTSATASTTTAAAAGKCPENMIAIPGGAMFMGARDLIEQADAKPPHRVQISTFCIDKTEVTTAAYQACVDKGVCERALDHVSWPNVTDAQKKKYSDFCNAGKADRAAHPINCVAWPMADNYCRQMGRRLPTEAEWEYAARGSSQKKYPWGDEPPSATRLNACGKECAEHWKKSANETRKTMFEEDDGHVGTSPVGAFPAGASAHGVLDLAGNVWEWTSDYYAPYAETDSASPPVDPKGPDKGDRRVLRGGDFLGSEPDWSRPAYRWKTDPDTYNHAIGFRCAATPR
ncbi:MAG: bifunctional serine/threonine-protein kinase/formylglycine-generating enzyme family protein [Polyangiaceae bacterium]